MQSIDESPGSTHFFQEYTCVHKIIILTKFYLRCCSRNFCQELKHGRYGRDSIIFDVQRAHSVRSCYYYIHKEKLQNRPYPLSVARFGSLNERERDGERDRGLVFHKRCSYDTMLFLFLFKKNPMYS